MTKSCAGCSEADDRCAHCRALPTDECCFDDCRSYRAVPAGARHYHCECPFADALPNECCFQLVCCGFRQSCQTHAALRLVASVFHLDDEPCHHCRVRAVRVLRWYAPVHCHPDDVRSYHDGCCSHHGRNRCACRDRDFHWLHGGRGQRCVHDTMSVRGCDAKRDRHDS